MALTAHCPVCDRTVYIEEGTTPICPVCSTPLLDTVDNADAVGGGDEAAEPR